MNSFWNPAAVQKADNSSNQQPQDKFDAFSNFFANNPTAPSTKK
jgi:hypothetical protein